MRSHQLRLSMQLSEHECIDIQHHSLRHQVLLSGRRTLRTERRGQRLHMRERLGLGEPESYDLLCYSRCKCQCWWKWEFRARFLNSFFILRDNKGRNYHNKSREHDSSGSECDDAGSSVYSCGGQTLSWGGDGRSGDFGSGRILKDGQLFRLHGLRYNVNDMAMAWAKVWGIMSTTTYDH